LEMIILKINIHRSATTKICRCHRRPLWTLSMESNPGTGYLCHLGIHPIFPGDHCLPNSLDFDERPSV